MSQVLENTYYGPAPQQTGGGSTSLDSQTQGSLTCYVAQQCEIRSGEQRGDAVLVEKFKGPHSKLKTWPTEVFLVGDKRDESIGKIKGIEGVLRFNVPDCPNDRNGIKQDWLVSSCVCQQTAAGDHSIVTVTYKASSAHYVVTAMPSEDPLGDQWSLSWMPYTVSPVAFAANATPKGAYDATYLADKDAKDVTGDNADKDHLAWRTNIENFRNSKVGDKSKYTWQDSKGGALKVLYYSEKAIVSKINRGESAIYHYPVVKHKKVTKKAVTLDYRASKTDYPARDDSTNIDFFTDSLPSDCPFSAYYAGLTGIYPNWKWLKIDDSVETSYEKGEMKWTHVTKWQGMPNPDVNFYGSEPFSHSSLETCRWIVGSL